MNSKGRRYTRNIFLGLILAIAAAWLAPHFLGASHYRAKLQAALTRALGRPVKFGEISIHLFPQPGFTLRNVVVSELPAFGSEAFGKAATLSCNLRWRSFWQSRLSISSLTLEDASLNVVRDAEGRWNIEEMLARAGRGGQAVNQRGSGGGPMGLNIVVQNARLNFIIGQTKKPLAVTDVTGKVYFDHESRLIRFQLSGSPVRTDLNYPSPGNVEFSGKWLRGGVSGGELDATLKARQTLLYDWIPLLSGANPGIYGAVDSTVHVAGPVEDPQFDGQVAVTQLHRWEQLPVAESLPCNLHFRGDFNRVNGQLNVASLDLAFANSQVHFSGMVSGIPAALNFDLVLGMEHSRLVDFANLYRHLTGGRLRQEIGGQIDGMLTIRGPWNAPRYGGFISARNVSLRTSAGTFPVSEIALRIFGDRAMLAPVRLVLAPHVEAVVEGALERLPRIGRSPLKLGPPTYELKLRADSVPMHDLLRFARGIGLEDARNIDAQGVTTMAIRLSGTVWPLSKPRVSARAAIKNARLLLPGLTQALNIPRAWIAVRGSKVLVSPFVAVMGTSVFKGKIEHQGSRDRAWTFKLRANHLDLQQSAGWFEVLGKRPPAPLLQHLPGISSFLERRKAESGLFDRLNVEGRFETPSLNYEDLTLRRVAVRLRIHNRKVDIERSAFRAGEGAGSAQVSVDLAKQPARWSGDFSLVDARVGKLASRFPPQLSQARGFYSASGRLRTQGLTRSELTANLHGTASIGLRNVALGHFDLLRLLAKEAGGMAPDVPARPSVIDSARARFTVASKKIRMDNGTMDLAGTRLAMSGTYHFEGLVHITVQGKLDGVQRRWNVGGRGPVSASRFAKLDFTGVIGHGLISSPPSVPQGVR